MQSRTGWEGVACRTLQDADHWSDSFLHLSYSVHVRVSHCYTTGFQMKTAPCTTGQKS